MELKIVRSLINELNQKNILYCHWKSNQHIKDVFTGKDDIDLLVDRGSIPRLNIILNDLGFKRFSLPDKRRYIGIEDYLGYDKEQGKLVHLHLHYQLTVGEKFLKGYHLPFESFILNRRIYYNKYDVYITSHEDEMWLLLVRLTMKIRYRDYIKHLLGKYVIDSTTKEEYKWLYERVDKEEYIKVILSLFGKDLAHMYSSQYKLNLCFKDIRTIRKKTLNICKPFKIYTRLGATCKKWNREAFRIYQELNKYILKRPKLFRRSPIAGGISISFIGPDGAGKSTIINDLKLKLTTQMDTKYIYLGSGDGKSSLLRKPLSLVYNFFLKKNILDRKSKKVGREGKTYRNNEGEKAALIRKLGEVPWIWTLAIERKRKIQTLRKFRNKGFVVITDRFPQDQFNNICDGPRYYKNPNVNKSLINRMLSKKEQKYFELAKITPPDLVFILNVSSNTAALRKPDEVDIESHKIMMKSILELDFTIDTKVIEIDANQSYNKVFLSVMDKLWREL